jgi:hypothetical protein
MRAIASYRSGLVALAGVVWVLTAVAPRTVEAQALAEPPVSNAAALTAEPALQPTTSRQAFDPEQATDPG